MSIERIIGRSVQRFMSLAGRGRSIRPARSAEFRVLNSRIRSKQVEEARQVFSLAYRDHRDAFQSGPGALDFGQGTPNGLHASRGVSGKIARIQMRRKRAPFDNHFARGTFTGIVRRGLGWQDSKKEYAQHAPGQNRPTCPPYPAARRVELGFRPALWGDTEESCLSIAARVPARPESSLGMANSPFCLPPHSGGNILFPLFTGGHKGGLACASSHTCPFTNRLKRLKPSSTFRAGPPKLTRMQPGHSKK
jgi:hypothetical protein